MLLGNFNVTFPKKSTSRNLRKIEIKVFPTSRSPPGRRKVMPQGKGSSYRGIMDNASDDDDDFGLT